MVVNTEDWDDPKGNTPPVLRWIAPGTLDDLLTQARDEEWTDLVLLGPTAWTEWTPQETPSELRGRIIYKLTDGLDNLPRGLRSLVHLQRLALRDLDLSTSAVKCLVTSLRQLTSLDLSGNRVGDKGANAIVENLRQLTELSLADNPVKAEGLRSIVNGLRQLVSLNLQSVWVGDKGVKAIADNLKQLRSLNLRENAVEVEGAQAIAAHLEHLTSLNLGANLILAEGAKSIAAHLPQLTSLELWDNVIRVEGARAIAKNLKQLTSLELGGNGLGDEGAEEIASHLPRLVSLGFWRNDVGVEGAKAIASHLTRLTYLSVSENRVEDEGAKAIARHLKQLLFLDLRACHLGDEGAQAIAGQLKQLTSLDLCWNQLGDESAKTLARQLTNLTSLDLSVNRVGDEGAKAIASGLGKLTSLDLTRNHVGDEGTKAIASRLTQLASLSLGENLVGDEGAKAVVEGLPCLERLSLRKNPHVRSVAWNVVPRGLRNLDLTGTGVTDLSPLRTLIEAGIPLVLQGYPRHGGIRVGECPLVRPTPEIVQQGHYAVLNYFREIERQGIDRLYEAKVLLVGDGGVGKTSLLRRLYYPQQRLPDEDQSTRGIDVHVQHFERAGGGRFRLNVWDFGGQQIYHATHQFFLTKNSLYVLVDDTRKDNKSVHDEGFKYWFEVVEAFGGKSPVLIFQNEKGGRSKKIDEAGIKGRFPNVQQTLRGDLSQTDAAEGLGRAIEQLVQDLPHVGEAVPAKWVAIRADIEKVSEDKATITLDEYLALYERHLEPDRDKALHLSRYLHDIGVFLHFQDDLRLRKTVILQNHWATEAVFRVLDDEQVKGRPGYFDRSDCARFWADAAYADMHGELLALMEKFELCYQLVGKERWLVPQLLCPSTPAYVKGWAAANDLVLTYRYEFLPRGLVSRLMVRMHRFVAHPEKSWANGALFEYQGTELLALTESTGDTITLRARGSEKKALLSVVASALDELNASFQGLEGKIHKKVPCICEQCKQATTPEQFDEQRLLRRRKDGKLSIECPTSYDEVSVLELLDGVKLEHLPTWAETPRSERTIRIFLASSEELRGDRDEFELHFRQQNDLLRKRGYYLEIIRWENFLDAVSETRKQDDYNAKIRACEIFVALFKSKTGKFTDEEFDIAHEQFRATRSPRIYTFFKQTDIPATKQGQADLATLLRFQEKLERLGHFWTKYESTKDLLLQFGRQLEKLEDTNFDWKPASG